MNFQFISYGQILYINYIIKNAIHLRYNLNQILTYFQPVVCIDDESSERLYRCKVKNCCWASNSIKTMLEHERKCRPFGTYECSQKVHKKPTDLARRELEVEGILPAGYHNMHFAVYDIVSD